jgi:putative transposase
MKYQCIQQHRGTLSIRASCGVLGVSQSGYYAWREQQSSKEGSDAEEARWVEKIRQLHQKSRCTYGSPRITAALRDEGAVCNRKRIARLMRKYGICAKHKRRFRRTTRANPRHRAAPNLLNQQFWASRPDEKWLSDFTFIDTAEGWLYLAAVEDVFSRKIVGWAMSEQMDTRLVLDALRMALGQRRPQHLTLLHHSDQGSQYTSLAYQQLLIDFGITISMSDAGNCYDNAMIESFFGTLKTECADYVFPDRRSARSELFAYIEAWYNPHRLHSGIGYCSPNNFEKRFYLDNN